MKDNARIPVAVIGSGNIGTDLMIKILRHAKHLRMSAMVGIDPAAEQALGACLPRLDKSRRR